MQKKKKALTSKKSLLKKSIAVPKKSFSKEIERTKTGINGFDELVEGGIPRGAFVLLSGGTGTGKSIFGMNFLASGIDLNEPGVYISLEESYDENRLQMQLFGWDIEEMQRQKKLIIAQPKMYDFDRLIELLQDAVTSIGAKRVVIDSISILELYFKDKFDTRHSIINLSTALKEIGVTTIAITEIDEGTGRLSRDSVEEFVSDGVIVLHIEKKDNIMSRAISVRKMRATNHSMKIHPMKIEKKKGIVIYPFEESFEDYK